MQFAGERQPSDTPIVPDHPNGKAHNYGTIEARRGPRRREDDPDHDHVPQDKAQDGGVRLPEGLHPPE